MCEQDKDGRSVIKLGLIAPCKDGVHKRHTHAQVRQEGRGGRR